VGHRGERAGHGAGRSADAGVVEQDDLAALGDRVYQGRVPIVEVAAEALEEDQRRGRAVDVAEPTVGKGDTVGGLDGTGSAR